MAINLNPGQDTRAERQTPTDRRQTRKHNASETQARRAGITSHGALTGPHARQPRPRARSSPCEASLRSASSVVCGEDRSEDKNRVAHELERYQNLGAWNRPLRELASVADSLAISIASTPRSWRPGDRSIGCDAHRAPRPPVSTSYFGVGTFSCIVCGVRERRTRNNVLPLTQAHTTALAQFICASLLLACAALQPRSSPLRARGNSRAITIALTCIHFPSDRVPAVALLV